MDSTVILTCILSSTLAATVITSIKELVLWILNRRAKLADDDTQGREQQIHEILEAQQKSIEGILESIENIQKKLALSIENDKIILKDKIRYLVFKYIDIGEITFEEKQAINHMWNIYHYDLGGNGDLNDVMELLETIPVKNRGVVAHE